MTWSFRNNVIKVFHFSGRIEALDEAWKSLGEIKTIASDKVSTAMSIF